MVGLPEVRRTSIRTNDVERLRRPAFPNTIRVTLAPREGIGEGTRDEQQHFGGAGQGGTG
jgi:hypothetical protein